MLMKGKEKKEGGVEGFVQTQCCKQLPSLTEMHKEKKSLSMLSA